MTIILYIVVVLHCNILPKKSFIFNLKLLGSTYLNSKIETIWCLDNLDPGHDSYVWINNIIMCINACLI